MVMLGAIALAVSLWVLGESLGVQPVLAAMMGLSVLLFTGEGRRAQSTHGQLGGSSPAALRWAAAGGGGPLLPARPAESHG
jgi:hypothetical protein